MDKNQYQIQSWINKLADINVTPENVIQWVYTVPIGAFDKMPYCPVFLYGNAGLDKAIIQVLKNSLDPKRVDITKNRYIMHLINSLEDGLSQQEAEIIINNMVDYNVIDAQTAKLMKVATNDKVLGLPKELRDEVRTRIFKNMLLNLI